MIFLIIITFPDICEIHFLHFYYSNWFDSVDQILCFLQKTHHFWKISQFFRWIYIHLQFLFVKFFFFTFLPSIISSVSKTLALSSVKSWSPILSEMRNILQSFVTRFYICRSSQRRCSVKRLLLNISQYSQRDTCRSLFLINLQSRRLVT